MLLWGCEPSQTETEVKSTETLFTLIDHNESGLDFGSELNKNNQPNYLLGSSGTAVADLNNDGLPDVFFTRKEGNRLYQNLGDLKFKDVTESANIIDTTRNKRKSLGVALADVNGDGWVDIYIAKRGLEWDSVKQEYSDYGRNVLYINNGDMTFTDRAKEYNLDIPGYAQCVNFFDYDNDGDLDLYIVNWPDNMNQVFDFTVYEAPVDNDLFVDKLMENIDGKRFVDVSKKAGLLQEIGFGNSVTASDINNDGWQDIFVGNDFFGRDYLYLNNGDKTFTEVGLTYFDKVPFFSMGSDFSDINNDGYNDLFIAEMMPENHYRQKLNVLPYSYEVYNKLANSSKAQYQRNMLQINNQGKGFTEVGFLSDVNATEWSWNTLFGDYDQDGLKDLFVTNGFKRDQVNIDFIKTNYGNEVLTGDTAWNPLHLDLKIENLPSFKISNFIFQNSDGIRFEKKNEPWGIIHPGHSVGAAHADFDNDGDLDFIIQNLDTVAYTYRNNAELLHKDSKWLKVWLKGSGLNTHGVGSRVYLFDGENMQMQEIHFSRGFRSSSEPVAHFGLGKNGKIDSLVVIWPGGMGQVITDVEPNQAITLHQQDASTKMTYPNKVDDRSYFTELDTGVPTIEHQESKFIDFKRDRMLHKQLSKEGPGIAVADVNGDGLEDFYIGGAAGQSGSLVLQSKDGSFILDAAAVEGAALEAEDMGSLFFDADMDGDMDLYIASGSNEMSTESNWQQDRLFLNDGRGRMIWDKNALPEMLTSTGVVTACDFDKDGDLDLFVGGRLVPELYPTAPRSYLLENNQGVFTDVTASVAVGLDSIGMITSAIWSDYDNDGWKDLIIVGEWMPITIFKNNEGKLSRSALPGLENSEGWWNSISGADFDQDGDIDYIAGNTGLNTYVKASVEQPISIYANDFDNNGTLDPVVFHYVTDVNIPFANRDIFCEQMPAFNNQYYTFEKFAHATADNMFEPEQVEQAYKLYTKTLASSYIENRGEEGFVITALPIRAQFGPIYGSLVDDVNGDGSSDVMIVGNSFSNHFEYGNYDALDGLVLLGDGKGGFKAVDGSACGLYAPGDAKALANLHHARSGKNLYLVSNSNSALQYFESKGQESVQYWKWEKGDEWATVTYNNGDQQKVERYLGSGYQSQQSSYNSFNPELVKEIKVENNHGQSHIVWPMAE